MDLRQKLNKNFKISKFLDHFLEAANFYSYHSLISWIDDPETEEDLRDFFLKKFSYFEEFHGYLKIDLKQNPDFLQKATESNVPLRDIFLPGDRSTLTAIAKHLKENPKWSGAKISQKSKKISDDVLCAR